MTRHPVFQVFLFVTIFVAGRLTKNTVPEPRSLAELSTTTASSSSLTADNKVLLSHEIPEIFQLAFQQSNGFFDDVTESDWKLYQSWARLQKDHRYNRNPHLRYGRPGLWYYNNYNPIFTCPHQKRIWGVGDGPKWLCDPHRIARQARRRRHKGSSGNSGPYCLIYSFGINGNYEFEDGLIKYLGDNNHNICEIHVFGSAITMDRPGNLGKNIHFHQLTLRSSSNNQGGNNGGDTTTASFPEILKLLGHEDKTIDIMMLDCEGCEWDTYRDWIHHDIRQILVETHSLPYSSDAGLAYFDAFKKNNYLMFSKELNGFGERECYQFSYLKVQPGFLNSAAPAPNSAELEPPVE